MLYYLDISFCINNTDQHILAGVGIRSIKLSYFAVDWTLHKLGLHNNKVHFSTQFQIMTIRAYITDLLLPPFFEV